MRKLYCLFIAFFPFFLSAQTTYYVKQNAGGNGNGLSWANAFTQLQGALQVAKSGDQIWIAKGTYKPSDGGDRAVFFDVKSGVSLFGGFNGAETSINERNWVSNPCILDGDLGVPGDSTDNSYNLMRLSNPSNTTVLDGITFQHALSNKPGVPFGDLGGNGGALLIDASTAAFPLIQHCRFLHNVATGGGGAVFIKSGTLGMTAPRFIDCYFENNRADSGGAVYRQGSAMQDTPDDFLRCQFIRNIANGSGSGITYADANGRTDTLDVIECVFEANEARSPITLPAGAFFTTGRSNGACLRFKNTEFTHNTSKSGSGIVFYSEEFPLKYLMVDSCRFDSNYSFSWNPSVSGLSISIFSGYYDGGILKSRYDMRHNQFYRHKGPMIELAMLSKNTLDFSYNDFIDNYNYYPTFGGGFAILSDTIYMDGNHFIDNPRLIAFNLTAYAYARATNNICRRSNFNLNCNITPIVFANNVYDGCNELNTFFPANKDVYFGNLVINNLFEIEEDPFLPLRKKWVFTNNIFANNRNLLTTNPAKLYQVLPFYHDSAYFEYNLFDFPNCDTLGSKSVCGVGNIFGVDPMLADTAAGNYQLLPCSPAFDAGSNTPYQTYNIYTDLLGRNRISDARADMGPIEGQPLTFSGAPQVQAACSDTSGAVSFPFVNGCPPYQYQWSSGPKTGQGSTGLAAGTYQFTITDYEGRLVYAYATVDAAHPPTVNGQTTAASCATCANGKVTLQVSGTSAYQYLWSNGTKNINLTQVMPGDYTVTITDAGSCTYTYSFTVPFTSAITDVQSNGGLQMMPNPVQTRLNVQWTAENVQKIAVYDVYGRLVQTENVSVGLQNAAIDLSGLAQGWYFLRLEGANRMLGFGKVLVLPR